jgi:YbbR domain-containing protein
MQQLDNGDKTLFLDINNSNNTVDVTQSGTGEHYLDIKLDTGNYAHDVDISQTGSGNHAARVELDGYSTDFDLNQQGSTDQDYNIDMTCGVQAGCTLSTTQGN